VATIAERVTCLEVEVLRPPSLPDRVRQLETWRNELRGATMLLRLLLLFVFGNTGLLMVALAILARNGWR
jgi:hypothetical protein